jgi:hypothetical protein
MRKRLTVPASLPCRLCGAMPRTRKRDVHFRPSDDYLFTETQIECSNEACSKEHRHFAPCATKREALLAWNKRNRVRRVAPQTSEAQTSAN